jgi:hypothetical protein
MEEVKLEYVGEQLHVSIPKDMTDEYGKLLIEDIEEKLQDWGIIEIDEIGERTFIDSGDKNIYIWDDKFTQDLKQTQRGILNPHGKLSDYIDLGNEKHQEFLTWYYGEPLEDAISQMKEDCK